MLEDDGVGVAPHYGRGLQHRLTVGIQPVQSLGDDGSIMTPLWWINLDGAGSADANGAASFGQSVFWHENVAQMMFDPDFVVRVSAR